MRLEVPPQCSPTSLLAELVDRSSAGLHACGPPYQSSAPCAWRGEATLSFQGVGQLFGARVGTVQRKGRRRLLQAGFTWLTLHWVDSSMVATGGRCRAPPGAPHLWRSCPLVLVLALLCTRCASQSAPSPLSPYAGIDFTPPSASRTSRARANWLSCTYLCSKGR
jgi:hypothetical protein